MNNSNKRVTQLPPTLGVKDAEVRTFLDALANAWDHRSGVTDSSSQDRFITAGEFQGMATNALVAALASAIPGAPVVGGDGGGFSPIEITDVIASISDEIKKSILYQILGTEIDPIDIPAIRRQINDAFSLAEKYLADTTAAIAAESEARAQADSAFTRTVELQATRIGAAEAAIVSEASTRSSQVEALTSSVNTQASRISASESAILSEANTRVNKDNAIAATVNRIWAAIGNNGAGIVDEQLAAVTPVAAQATKYNQLQAEVIDPNTGESRIATLRTDFSTYSNKTDGTLRSIYSVRVQSTTGSPPRTVVGGFGLALTQTGNAGPTIDFGVRADKFWVGDISGVGDLPFVVLTAPSTVLDANGRSVTRPAGTYIKDAFIGRASVGTLQVAGGSVTSMSYGRSGAASVPASGEIEVCRCYVDMPAGSSGVVLVANATAGPANSDQATGYLTIKRQDGLGIGFTAFSMVQSSQFSAVVTGFDPFPLVGSSWYALYVANPGSGPGGARAITVQTSAITATGGKR